MSYPNKLGGGFEEYQCISGITGYVCQKTE